MRQLVADRQCNEEAWKKWEIGKKTARGLLRLGRAVGCKGSKTSELGEDSSNSVSTETAENQAQQTKSKVAKREANEAWEEMKKGGRPRCTFWQVLCTLFLSRPLLMIMIGGQL